MTPPTPDRDTIAARAFALYVRRGRQPGRAMEDWLEAERQLRAEQTAPVPDVGTARGSLAGQPVPPRALPEAKTPPVLAAPPRAPALPGVLAPAPVRPAAPASAAVPDGPRPSGGGKKRRKR